MPHNSKLLDPPTKNHMILPIVKSNDTPYHVIHSRLNNWTNCSKIMGFASRHVNELSRPDTLQSMKQHLKTFNSEVPTDTYITNRCIENAIWRNQSGSALNGKGISLTNIHLTARANLHTLLSASAQVYIATNCSNILGIFTTSVLTMARNNKLYDASNKVVIA